MALSFSFHFFHIFLEVVKKYSNLYVNAIIFFMLFVGAVLAGSDEAEILTINEKGMALLKNGFLLSLKSSYLSGITIEEIK